MLRVLETVCAVTVLLHVALLGLAADVDAQRTAWRGGDLTQMAVVFVAAGAGWLFLWHRRTGRGVSARLILVQLSAGAGVLVLAAGVRWILRG